jgi:hypothetical protein
VGVATGGLVGGTTGAAVIGGDVTAGDGGGVGAGDDGALHFTGAEDPVELSSPGSSPLSRKIVSGAHPK